MPIFPFDSDTFAAGEVNFDGLRICDGHGCSIAEKRASLVAGYRLTPALTELPRKIKIALTYQGTLFKRAVRRLSNDSARLKAAP